MFLLKEGMCEGSEYKGLTFALRGSENGLILGEDVDQDYIMQGHINQSKYLPPLTHSPQTSGLDSFIIQL